jgi:hypothetical protein
MRYKDCGCPCNNCEVTTRSICEDFPNGTINKEIDDAIILGGEENGIFKILVRRIANSFSSIINGWTTFQNYLWLTVCVPMDGDIGSYHFTEDESPTDCYAYIKRVSCPGVSGYRYYFWIGTEAGMTEIPIDGVDKTNYLYLYGDPILNSSGTQVISYTPKYYLMRKKGLFEAVTTDDSTFVLPPSMNQNIPYVFWAAPLTYSLDIEFTSGQFKAYWCNLDGSINTSVIKNYTDYNGIYIIQSGLQSSVFGGYFGLGYYDDSPDGVGGQVVGYYYDCREYPLNYIQQSIELLFSVSGNGSGWTIAISNTGGVYQWGSANSSFLHSFDIDYIGDGQTPIDCVDQKMLDGQYGGYILESTNKTADHICPNAEEMFNGTCGHKSSFDLITPAVTCQVIEWGLKYGCL